MQRSQSRRQRCSEEMVPRFPRLLHSDKWSTGSPLLRETEFRKISLIWGWIWSISGGDTEEAHLSWKWNKQKELAVCGWGKSSEHKALKKGWAWQDGGIARRPWWLEWRANKGEEVGRSQVTCSLGDHWTALGMLWSGAAWVSPGSMANWEEHWRRSLTNWVQGCFHFFLCDPRQITWPAWSYPVASKEGMYIPWRNIWKTK